MSQGYAAADIASTSMALKKQVVRVFSDTDGAGVLMLASRQRIVTVVVFAVVVLSTIILPQSVIGSPITTIVVSYVRTSWNKVDVDATVLEETHGASSSIGSRYTLAIILLDTQVIGSNASTSRGLRSPVAWAVWIVLCFEFFSMNIFAFVAVIAKIGFFGWPETRSEFFTRIGSEKKER
jgi:hypothetical protein